MSKKLITTENYLLFVEKVYGFKAGDWNYEEDNTIPVYQFSYDIDKYPGNKIIAYYSLTKEVKELDLPLLPNPFKTYRVGRKQKRAILDEKGVEIGIFKTGSEEQAQKYCDYLNNKQFSLEDMKKAIEMAREYEFVMYGNGETEHKYSEDEIIQSLSTQQLPKEFIPEFDIVHTDHAPNGFEKVLKFKTNSEGKQELVGTYKY